MQKKNALKKFIGRTSLTFDLKKWRDGRYILYAIDIFTRFSVAILIKNKKLETISEALLEEWVPVFDTMEMLDKDGRSSIMMSLQRLQNIPM